MFLLFGEFFMLFNDKKLTMYTSSKKGLTSNSYHVYPCISFQLKIQGTYTENIILLEKKTYRISGNHAYVVSFHGPNCNMPQHCSWEEVLFLLCLKNLVWSLIYLFLCCGSNLPLVWSFSKKPDFYCPLLWMVLSIEHKIQTSLKMKRIEPQHRIHLLRILTQQPALEHRSDQDVHILQDRLVESHNTASLKTWDWNKNKKQKQKIK